MAHDTKFTNPKNFVILGGSYGGVSIAHNVLKHAIPKLPEPETYKVILISAASEAMCRPACPRALISDDLFPQEKLFVSIPKLFEQYPKDSFRFIHGSATNLDHNNRTVTIDENVVIEYYALVIATGASTPSPLLGLNQDVDSLRTSWNEIRKALPTAKSIVITGGGPAGIETAGELGEHLNGRAGMFSSTLAKPKVSITVVTAGSKILPILRPSIAKEAEQHLAKVGVTIIKNTRVKSVSPDGAGTSSALATKTAVTLEDGKTLDADIYIPATGTTPNTNFIDKALLAEDGRVATNVSTLRVDNAGPRVYAIGDVSSFSRPAIHEITEAVPVLSTNIKRDLLSDTGASPAGEDRIFKEDTRETHLVPIGKGKGVGAVMGWRVPSLFVWMIKGRDYWLWTTGDLWSGKQWAKEA